MIDLYLVELCIVRMITFLELYYLRGCYLLNFVIIIEFCIVLVLQYVHVHVKGYVSDRVLLCID